MQNDTARILDCQSSARLQLQLL